MYVVVEGSSDEWAARRVVEYAGRDVTQVRSTGGASRLDQKISNYSQAARQDPWVVFRDSDSRCPVELRNELLERASDNPLFALRIAHTMIEAWLMADREGFADYFRVSVDLVSPEPESLPHAKRALLSLCRHSQSRDIREEVAYDEAHPGPLFVDHLNEFARHHWDVGKAAESAPSLARAIRAIKQLG